MLTVNEALKSIEDVFLKSFAQRVVTLPLEKVRGLVLAEDLRADRDLPPFNRSAMDGFAITADDIKQRKIEEFRVLGTIHAGSALEVRMETGGCVRIMTGAPLPEGADAVIRVEDSVVREDRVRFEGVAVSPWLNVARRGEDTQAGRLLVPSGRVCDFAAMAVAASCGYGRLQVFDRPRVSVIVTGDEIVHVDESPLPHQIRDCNSYSMLSLLQGFGIEPTMLRARDDREILRQAIERGLAGDLLILTGGVSMGDLDFVPEILGAAGVERLFHKVRIRPGKPIWAGAGRKCMVFGLPGNPFSCQVGFMVFVADFIRRFMGLSALVRQRLPLGELKRKSHGFEEYFRCVVQDGRVYPLKHQGSGDFVSTLAADGLGVQPEDCAELAEGAEVDYITWSSR